MHGKTRLGIATEMSYSSYENYVGVVVVRMIACRLYFFSRIASLHCYSLDNVSDGSTDCDTVLLLLLLAENCDASSLLWNSLALCQSFCLFDH